MAEMKRVRVIHPTSGNAVDIDIPENMILQDIIDELIESNFITPNANGYQAVLKDGTEPVTMDLSKTLEENGGLDNSTIRLLPFAP